MNEPLLQVEDLARSYVAGGGLFGRGSRMVQAVREVDFTIAPAETLGLVGESGCGKTTVARMITGLVRPTQGQITLGGKVVVTSQAVDRRQLSGRIQMVFQDPYSSLNPRMRVADIVAEPLINLGLPRAEIRRRVAELLEIVGLRPEHASRFPHSFSGGQRQRIALARALGPRPQLIVCDEAVSALDVSIQAQVLNLLADVQRDLALAMLFISHNLGVVRHVSHRIAVMYLGQIVELASESALFSAPQHPYTQTLIAAVPEPDPDIAQGRLEPMGDLPDPFDPPTGCAFHDRCPRAQEECRRLMPELRPLAEGHLVRCHYPG